MEVLKRKQNLGSVELRLAERELLPLDMQHQISSTDVLHNEVNPSFSLEARMQPKQKWVALFRCGQEDPFLRARTTVRIRASANKS